MDKLKEIRDKNPLLDFLAGFIPGVGEALDIHDFAHAAKNKNYAGMALAAATLVIPGFSSAQIKRLVGQGITIPQIQKLSDMGFSYADESKTLGDLILDANGKKFNLTSLKKKFQDIFGKFDYGFDESAVQKRLKEYLDRTGRLAEDYPGLARMLDRGHPDAVKLMDKARKIVDGDNIPIIHGGTPDALTVARAQGNQSIFELGYHGDAPFVGKDRKTSKSFGGYFFLTQGEKAKQAAMAYSHFADPDLVLLMSLEAGLPVEVAKKAQQLSKRIHDINKELGIKNYKKDGSLRSLTDMYGHPTKFQYETDGMLKEEVLNSGILDEYAAIGELLTNLFKYTPTGLKIGAMLQYIFTPKVPFKSTAVIEGSGDYNNIINPTYTRTIGNTKRKIKLEPPSDKHSVLFAETYFGKQGVDKITTQGINNPFPGVNTIGLNPEAITLLYKKGNKLCKK